MSAKTRINLAAALLAALSTGACTGDAPTAPLAVGSDTRVNAAGLLGSADVVARRRPLTQDVSASALIGPRGGRLELPEVGLTVEVPPGAVFRATNFRVTAVEGDLVAYEFEPHGSVFGVPLHVTQRLEGIDLGSLGARSSLKVGYFSDRSRLDFRLRRAEIDEMLPTTVDLEQGEVSFFVRHFSGYMVSSGNVKGPKGGGGSVKPSAGDDDIGEFDDDDRGRGLER